uniref:Signal peptidase complex subunit 1 n=1 Tax=Steinernema glaseri TaxID=37863 RepID=A0A1I7Z0U6_9BILA
MQIRRYLGGILEYMVFEEVMLQSSVKKGAVASPPSASPTAMAPNDRCLCGLVHVKQGTQRIGMYYLAEGVLYFTASTKALEDKHSEIRNILAILYIFMGLATLYGVKKNRPYFLLPLMAYTPAEYEFIPYLPKPSVLIGALCLFAVFAIFKAWFLKAVYDCFKYI